MISEEFMESMLSEIRRGSIVLCVLSRLEKPKYGYALQTELAEGGLAVDAGTLYPLLRRLEKNGLLQSEWNTDGSKPRKYYSMNGDGLTAYEKLRQSWRELRDTVQAMID